MKRFFAFGAIGCVVALLPTTVTARASGNDADTSIRAPVATDRHSLDSASLAVARQILAAAFPATKRAQMYRGMMQSLVNQSLDVTRSVGVVHDKEFQAVIDRQTRHMFEELNAAILPALPEYFESMARAYARNLSRDDLNGVLAFVKTPAGQHYFDLIPQIMKDPDVQAAGQRMMSKMMEKAPEIVRENKREIDAYVAKRSN